MHKIELDKFQGPLDLLLYFIRRDELDINDIPIAEITAEYLQTIEDMKAMNLSVAGEFILMAATLMRIKSKMLIPRAELDDLGEPIDPRTELVQQLIEYKKYKDIADNLSEKWEKLSYQHERSLIETFNDQSGSDLEFKSQISDVSNELKQFYTERFLPFRISQNARVSSTPTIRSLYKTGCRVSCLRNPRA